VWVLDDKILGAVFHVPLDRVSIVNAVPSVSRLSRISSNLKIEICFREITSGLPALDNPGQSSGLLKGTRRFILQFYISVIFSGLQPYGRALTRLERST